MLRRFIYLLVVIVFLIAAYLITAEAFPKDTGRFPFFIILLLLDAYLWFSIKKRVFSLKPLTKYFITVVYWIPLAAFIIVGLMSWLLPVKDWDTVFISYLFGTAIAFYLSKLFAIIFFLLADFMKIIHFFFKFIHAKKKKKPFRQEAVKMNRAKFLQTIGLAGGGLLFSGLMIGIVKWAYDFRIRREYIRLPDLPKAFDGLRIVQISDLHLGSWASVDLLDEAVGLINSLKPDLVLFTGDLVNSTTDEAFRFKDSLARIKARDGIFAVLGNHDYGDYVTWPSEEAKKQNMLRLYHFYKSMGWRLLRNENYLLKKGQNELAIVGIENWGFHKRFPKLGDLNKALQGAETAPVRILMSHDPTHWEYIVSKDHPEIDLTLSGHTHGFQFGVEYKRIKWSLAQYMFKYWAGMYSVLNGSKKQYLYVNRGLGMIGYPGRIGILPEITLITLEV